jgi:hypothetical protein
MDRIDDVATLLDELVTAIQMRDESDPDSHDWTLDARVRHLERQLVVLHRTDWPRTLVPATGRSVAPILAGIS